MVTGGFFFLHFFCESGLITLIVIVARRLYKVSIHPVCDSLVVDLKSTAYCPEAHPRPV